jgi:hypothetical protein
VNDKLSKLGYRLRTVKSEPKDGPGEIAFDDRGNAVYQWKDDQFVDDTEVGERLRKKALEHPGLSIVDDEPRSEAMIQSNPKGVRLGYNPYQSGLLDKKTHRSKRDLRELSRWIETKRRMEQKKNSEE